MKDNPVGPQDPLTGQKSLPTRPGVEASAGFSGRCERPAKASIPENYLAFNQSTPGANADRRSPRWPLWLRLLALALLAAALIAPLVIWHDALAQLFAERQQIVAAIRQVGAWGPLALIGLAVAQTVIAPIPGQAINFVSGYLYGLGPGLLYAWLGLMLGTSLAMVLARYAGRPLVERLVDRGVLAKVDRLAEGRGLRFFFLFFLIPGLPDDILCFVAGLTRLPLRVLIPLAAVARLPGLLGMVWLGAYAERMPWPVWVAVGAVSVIALWAVWRYGDRLERAWLARLR